MLIHDRIREARNNANLSVNALAKKVGVTSTCVWNWDHENTSPRPDKLPRIAEALGVSEAYLTGESDIATPNNQSPGASAETLDNVLTDASARIAKLLGIDPDRVSVTFSLNPS